MTKKELWIRLVLCLIVLAVAILLALRWYDFKLVILFALFQVANQLGTPKEKPTVSFYEYFDKDGRYGAGWTAREAHDLAMLLEDNRRLSPFRKYSSLANQHSEGKKVEH